LFFFYFFKGLDFSFHSQYPSSCHGVLLLHHCLLSLPVPSLQSRMEGGIWTLPRISKEPFRPFLVSIL
jgi:hypothetical protein